MKPTDHGTRNLFATFSLRGGRLRKRGRGVVSYALFLMGAVSAVVLGLLSALSTPSLAQPVDRLNVAAIDDVVAGDEGWIIGIDDVAADAGGWITAIDDVAARDGGGIAAYAAEAGGGFAAFGDVASEVGGGIAAFGKVEKELANIAVGVETSINNFTAGGGFEFDSTADDSEPIDDDISVVIIDPEKETPREDGNTIVGIGRLFDENGRELFPEDFNINNPATDPGDKTPSSDKTPTSKPDERTIDFSSDESRENTATDDEDWSDIEYDYGDYIIFNVSRYSAGSFNIIQSGEGNATYYQRGYLETTDNFGKEICVYGFDMINGEYYDDYYNCDVFGERPGLHGSDIIHNVDVVTSGEIINPPVHPSPAFRKAGIYVSLPVGSTVSGYLDLTNSAKISDVDFGIDAYHNGSGSINITNNGEIWNVRKHGIRASLRRYGKINITISEDIKILSDSVFSDVYMIGGIEHNLVLKDGIVLTDVSFGVDKRSKLQSKWNVDSGNNQQETFEGFVDYGAFRYTLDHEVVEGGNTWKLRRGRFTPYVDEMFEYLKTLPGVRLDAYLDAAADRDDRIDSVHRDGGFWAHQNSLRSSDDSVHFGFDTPVVSFMGGGLVVSNSIAPNLSTPLLEGMSMSNSIGLDYHFDVMGFSVSPQMELAWTRFDFDDFTGPENTGRVSLEDGDIVTGRLGLLFDGEYVYGGINLHTAIDGKTALNISGVSIVGEQDELSVDGLLGFSYDWSENYRTYGEVFMSSRDGAEEVRANLGMRIEF